MSQRMEPTCEKFINRYLKTTPVKKASVKPPGYQDKLSTLTKVYNAGSLKAKTRTSIVQPSSHSPRTSSEQSDEGKKPQNQKPRHRSASSCAATDREPWGQLLNNKQDKNKASSFSNFDPLRTLHFLSKELFFRLQTILPENTDVHQKVSDIQHALKRIPPEVASLIHLHQTPDLATILSPKPSTLVKRECKSSQTPPTLYQEDSEKFQKMMEVNTFKLSESCRQLEIVCTNLEKEKRAAEIEAAEQKQATDVLLKRIRVLETDLTSRIERVRQLEVEKRALEEEVEKMVSDWRNSPTISQLTKLVDELKEEKLAAEQKSARLEYDMTMLSMEKEKFVTMLNVRDKEIKEIQEEMSRIQDQVSQELSRLNSDMVSKAGDIKVGDDKQVQDAVGDAVVTAVGASETANVMRETGDATVANEKKVSDESDSVLDFLFGDMSPSCKALLAGDDL